MNKVILIGRMSKDPEERQTTTGTTAVRFTVAVDRKNREQGADFINIVAFNKTGEFVSKYFSKGSRIGIVGRLSTGSYTNKEGKKIYTTEVIADEVEFVESKKKEEPGYAEVERAQAAEGFMHVNSDSEGLPFI